MSIVSSIFNSQCFYLEQCASRCASILCTCPVVPPLPTSAECGIRVRRSGAVVHGNTILDFHFVHQLIAWLMCPPARINLFLACNLAFALITIVNSTTVLHIYQYFSNKPQRVSLVPGRFFFSQQCQIILATFSGNWWFRWHRDEQYGRRQCN
jgi:hypothetical protein